MYGKPEKCRINHYKVPLPVSFLCKEIAMKSGSGHVRFFFSVLTHLLYIQVPACYCVTVEYHLARSVKTLWGKHFKMKQLKIIGK